jgi:hypothetical protein
LEPVLVGPFISARARSHRPIPFARRLAAAPHPRCRCSRSRDAPMPPVARPTRSRPTRRSRPCSFPDTHIGEPRGHWVQGGRWQQGWRQGSLPHSSVFADCASKLACTDAVHNTTAETDRCRRPKLHLPLALSGRSESGRAVCGPVARRCVPKTP